MMARRATVALHVLHSECLSSRKSMIRSNETTYMRRAIELARKGMGRVSPNPMVGAVIVKNGNIISEGYHANFGGDHAEVAAIKRAKESVAGTTMYVTLEPCSHFGKTPPCVNAIIEHQIKRVVIGCIDPDPLVYKKGCNKLSSNGVEVEIGLLHAGMSGADRGFRETSPNRHADDHRQVGADPRRSNRRAHGSFEMDIIG